MAREARSERQVMQALGRATPRSGEGWTRYTPSELHARGPHPLDFLTQTPTLAPAVPSEISPVSGDWIGMRPSPGARLLHVSGSAQDPQPAVIHATRGPKGSTWPAPWPGRFPCLASVAYDVQLEGGRAESLALQRPGPLVQYRAHFHGFRGPKDHFGSFLGSWRSGPGQAREPADSVERFVACVAETWP